MKRKPLALLLAALITLGTLTSCDLNALLTTYLETTPTASDGVQTSPPADTVLDAPATHIESDIQTPPETIDDSLTETTVETLAETEPEDPKPLETSTTVPPFTPIGKWELAAPNLTGTPGTYSADPESFSVIGNVKMEWMPDAAQRLNLRDGNLSDWAELGLTPTVITPNHMLSWAEFDDMPEGWQMTAHFLADPDYLYICLSIVDPVVVACWPDNPQNYGSGDAVQINIDFGRKLGHFVENDPDSVPLLTNTQCIFYSFAYNGDGGPIGISVQQSDNDHLLTEEKGGIIGSTGKTEDGWCAEVAIPWQELYDNFINKWYLDPDDEEFSRIFLSRENPFLELGMSFYYLDKIGEDGSGQLTWAAGTHSGFTGTASNGTLLDPVENPPVFRWDVYDISANVYLPWRSDLHFNCDGIDVEN